MTDQFQRAISAAAEELTRSSDCQRRDFLAGLREAFPLGARKALEILSQPASAEHGPRVWAHFPEERRQGSAKAYVSVSPPNEKTNPAWKPEEYCPTTELLAERAKRVELEAELRAVKDAGNIYINELREKVTKLRAALEVNQCSCVNGAYECKRCKALADTEAAPIEAEKEKE